MSSPYERIAFYEWKLMTQKLVEEHPLDPDEIVDVTLAAWDGIMRTKIADELQIGVDIYPSPQILGNYLHELIPVYLAKRYPSIWRKEVDKMDKKTAIITRANQRMAIILRSTLRSLNPMIPLFIRG